MIGFLHYTIPLSLKILICLLILASMIVVYFWEPGRKKMNRRNKTHHALQYMEADPARDFAGKEILLQPRRQRVQMSHHMTLQELDEYVQTLKRNKIKNLDEV